MALLKIRNLHVSVDNRKILHGVNLKIDRGETHIIMGPNASGKTTLAMTMIGYPAYRVTKGQILFEGKDICNLGIHDRAQLGIAVTFQNPPAIRGVKLRDLLRLCAGLEPWNPLKEPHEAFASKVLEEVGMNSELYLNRDVNLGFSGGEKKRVEVAQMLCLKPKLMVLDEPDSGVDLDSLKLIGNKINGLATELGSAVLVITHYRHILPYLKPRFVHILYNGRIVDSGDSGRIIPRLEELGYEGYVKRFCRAER